MRAISRREFLVGAAAIGPGLAVGPFPMVTLKLTVSATSALVVSVVMTVIMVSVFIV